MKNIERPYDPMKTFIVERKLDNFENFAICQLCQIL